VRDILYLPALETTPRIRTAIRGILQTATWAEIPASEAMYYVGKRNFILPFAMRGIVLAPANEICNATREAVRADTFRRFELNK